MKGDILIFLTIGYGIGILSKGDVKGCAIIFFSIFGMLIIWFIQSYFINNRKVLTKKE